MFSKPPAMMQSLSPAGWSLGRLHHGLEPEPQTLLMVTAFSVLGQTGAEPRLTGRVLAEPACSTHPMMHSSMWSFGAGDFVEHRLDRVRAQLGRGDVFISPPKNLPMGVRFAATITGCDSNQALGIAQYAIDFLGEW
jgi:hypothetical protein